jgi:hypothetical protein
MQTAPLQFENYTLHKVAASSYGVGGVAQQVQSAEALAAEQVPGVRYC